MIKKTVGGDRLGTGGVLTTSLQAYERSTHNLDKVTKTTQTVGTLVPIYVELVEKADIWDIELSNHTLTHPTVGPIFGMYKQQIDVFTGDFRLYQKQLHNNPTGVGLDMDKVLLPQLRLNAKDIDAEAGQLNQQQISQSSLLAYCGVRGLGTTTEPTGTQRVEIERQAVPVLMYYDIYKEYYANKQEQIGYVINPQPTFVEPEVTRMVLFRGSGSSGLSLYPDSADTTIRTYLAEGDTIEVFGKGLGAFGVAIYDYTGAVTDETQLLSYLRWDQVYIAADGTSIQYIGYRSNPRYPDAEQTVLARAGNILTGAWFITRQGTNVIQELGISEFPLTNIDDMRETILGAPKTSPLYIGYTGDEDRGLPYSAVVGQSEMSAGVPQGDMLSKFTNAGLAIKTHQADRFNAWLSTTWVERINAMTSINVVNGTFSIDALNIAKKMYKLNNNITVSGNSYQDWLEAIYGEKTYGAPEMPVYRGGMSEEISFEEVISSSEAGDQPLGTLGGRGVTMGGRVGGRLQFKAEEHGMIMIIASITPRISYSQGNKWWGKLKSIDDIHKPELDQIGFQHLLTDEMAAWDSKVPPAGTGGEEVFFSAGYQPSWTQYTTNQDESYGGFANENSEMFMVLDRRYQATSLARIEDLTTYIDPTKYLYPFAYTGLDAQPFWCQYGIKAKVRKKMAASQMPRP